MKKIIAVSLVFFMMIIPIKSFAINENVTVDVNISGEIKSGNTIEVKFNINNVQALYGAQIDYTYNPNEVEIISVDGGEFIKNDEQNIFEPFKDTNNGQNVARYGFTYMGDYKGQKGSGNLCIIKMNLLKDNALSINTDNTKIKLIERDKSDNMLSMNFKLNEFTSDGKSSESGSNNNSSNSNDSQTGNNSNNNSTDNNSNDNSSSGAESGENDSVEKDNNSPENNGYNKTSVDEESNNSGTEHQENEEEIKNIGENNNATLIGISMITLIALLCIGYFVYYKKKK